MDNITHSLVGAALAEVALPSAPRSPRRIFYLAGIAAANFPDLDLAYSRITPGPLGYLLHHRGHTHTIGGLVIQAMLIGVICYAIAPIRRLESGTRMRLWTLVSVALLSHVMLDAGNSYGVHPLWPFSSRWFYGDAVFIFEPWLWMLLGIPVAMAAVRRTVRVSVAGAIAVLAAVLGIVGFVPWPAILILFATIAVFGWLLRRVEPRTRVWLGIAAATAFVVTTLGLSQIAEASARTRFASTGNGQVLEIIRSADPGNPVCWSIIGVQLADASREYVFRPATLSLMPGLVPPARCASHRVRGIVRAEWNEPAFVTYSELRQSVDTLRALNARDCAVRAWLQFGRAPVVQGGEIFDYRYARGGANFSAMPLQPASRARECPPNLTSWGQPRADLLRARTAAP